MPNLKKVPSLGKRVVSGIKRGWQATKRGIGRMKKSYNDSWKDTVRTTPNRETSRTRQ